MSRLTTLRNLRHQHPALADAILYAATTRKVAAKNINEEGSDLFDEQELLSAAEVIRDSSTYIGRMVRALDPHGDSRSEPAREPDRPISDFLRAV